MFGSLRRMFAILLPGSLRQGFCLDDLQHLLIAHEAQDINPRTLHTIAQDMFPGTPVQELLMLWKSPTVTSLFWQSPLDSQLKTMESPVKFPCLCCFCLWQVNCGREFGCLAVGDVGLSLHIRESAFGDTQDVLPAQDKLPGGQRYSPSNLGPMQHHRYFCMLSSTS